jgi:NAD-dependent dihydropyrimidine dehydrogenase PreA subunit
MTPSSDMPMREASRDGSGGCLMCGRPRPSTRARYCTRACQQRSFRLRHHTPAPDLTTVRKVLQPRKELVAYTIYECSGCGERFLGERRCGACNLFTRALGLGGSCPECDTPVLIEDLLGEGVLPIT